MPIDAHNGERCFLKVARHSCTIHQPAKGVETRYIQAWLGHKGLETVQGLNYNSEHNYMNLKIRWMNYFSKKVGLHTLNGIVSQPDMNEMAQLVGLHIRWAPF